MSTTVIVSKELSMATSEGHVKETREIHFLVTGKAGSGKSSLVNGILGLKIEDEGIDTIYGEGEAKENDSNTQLKTCTTGRAHYSSSLAIQ